MFIRLEAKKATYVDLTKKKKISFTFSIAILIDRQTSNKNFSSDVRDNTQYKTNSDFVSKDYSANVCVTRGTHIS